LSFQAISNKWFQAVVPFNVFLADVQHDQTFQDGTALSNRAILIAKQMLEVLGNVIPEDLSKIQPLRVIRSNQIRELKGIVKVSTLSLDPQLLLRYRHFLALACSSDRLVRHLLVCISFVVGRMVCDSVTCVVMRGIPIRNAYSTQYAFICMFS